MLLVDVHDCVCVFYKSRRVYIYMCQLENASAYESIKYR